MNEKTTTCIQCTATGLGFALSIFAFAYACWLSHQRKKQLPPMNPKDLLPPKSPKLEDKEDGERKIDPKFIKVICRD